MSSELGNELMTAVFGGNDDEKHGMSTKKKVLIAVVVVVIVILLIIVVVWVYRKYFKTSTEDDPSSFQNAGAGAMSTKVAPARMGQVADYPLDRFEGNDQDYHMPKKDRLYTLNDDYLDNFDDPMAFTNYGAHSDTDNRGPDMPIRAFRPESDYKHGNNQSTVANLLNDY